MAIVTRQLIGGFNLNTKCSKKFPLQMVQMNNIKCNFPPYGQDFPQQRPTGRFSNGKIPGHLIAEKLGIKDLLPAYYDPKLTPEDLLTGVSFASGGSGHGSLTPKIASAISLSDQLKLFIEYKEKIKAIAGEERTARIVSDSLYVVINGTDDIANTYYSIQKGTLRSPFFRGIDREISF